jgi:hypothetical protein
MCSAVFGEGGALGSWDVAAVGLSRHGAGWRGVGCRASTVLGGVDCATNGVVAEGSAMGSQGEAAAGVPRQGADAPPPSHSHHACSLPLFLLGSLCTLLEG